MSQIPSGLSVQAAYQRFRNSQIIVNRKYQRKLVWTTTEKQKLVDSILNGFPIPLILFAEKTNDDGILMYEILDGMQRLNAIFGYIENEYDYDGKYFDVNELTRAKQMAEAGVFNPILDHASLLDKTNCANFLDYQLAVTSYHSYEENTIYEIFGRINSGGKRLSGQEQRQAGVICDFSDLVRSIGSEIRGDSTQEIVNLCDMPEISIGSSRVNDQYGLKAEEIFWVKQGILSVQNLRDSHDEEMIADIAVSILLNSPFARSKEALDNLYDLESDLYNKLNIGLLRYTPNKLKEDITNTYSVLKNTIESISSTTNFFRNILSTARNPIKNGFYTVYMAFFELLVKKDLSPYNNSEIINQLKNLQGKLTTGRHYVDANDRSQNINLTIGLIQNFFAKKEPSSLKHGAGLAIDFENSIRRSKIETPRYEFKQGFLRLSDDRKYDKALEEQILNTICAMANIGPNSESYIFIGVADKKADADRIKNLDQTSITVISNHFVVGIDREAVLLGITVEDYCRRIVGFISKSSLSKFLITSVLSEIDIIDYKDLSVIRIKIPPQTEISYCGEDVYIRQYNNTMQVTTPKDIIKIADRFKK